MSRRVTSTNPKPSKIPRPVLTASKDVAGVRSNTNHTEGVDILTSRPVFTSDEMRDLWEIAELHSLRELKIKIAEVIIDEKGLLIKTKGLHPLRELTTAITEMTTVGKELLIMAKGQNIHQGLNAEELDSIKAHLHARREKAKIDEMKARNELLELELAQHAKDLAQATLEKQKRRECDLKLVVRMNDSVDDLVAGEMHLSHEAHLVQRVSNICVQDLARQAMSEGLTSDHERALNQAKTMKKVADIALNEMKEGIFHDQNLDDLYAEWFTPEQVSRVEGRLIQGLQDAGVLYRVASSV